MDTGWRGWLYQKWNERLVEYCFQHHEGLDDKPVERVPATPEELVEAVGDPSAKPEEVVEAFVTSVGSRIPLGVSFEGFCSDYRGWSPNSDEPPHFFAALWLTCLVAYGYPEGGSGFHERMTKVFGRHQHVDCLPELWYDMEEWTWEAGARSSGAVGYRTLKLPPGDDYRSNIGHSWFLAFPHQHDRRKLRELLERNDLVGEEPPIRPVVDVLERNKREFGKFFREDLEFFVDAFVETGADVRESPFWRAVRQEALSPIETLETFGAPTGTGLMAFLDDDELSVYVACSDRARLPSGFSMRDLGLEIDGFSNYVVVEAPGEEGEVGMDQAALAALEGGLEIPEAHRHARRGVLVFQEVITNEYRLAGGPEANQAGVALVKNDKVGAFTRAYGGKARPSRLSGWRQVIDCKVVILPKSPPGLEGVRHLQETMVPPSVRFAGGIRTGAGFYALPGFLPVVRFDGAERVEIMDEGGELVGEARRSASNGNEWHLPEKLLEEAPGRWRIVVHWFDPADHARTSAAELTLVGRQIPHGYKRLGAGRYYVEACAPGEKEVAGREDIPIGIAAAEITEENDRAGPDLVEFEPDLRYLGPGLGEISPTPLPGFDWLVTGPKNRPDLLMFVGNPRAPTKRTNRRCEDAGARRHWRGAIRDSRCVAVRLPDGSIVPVTEVPQVENALREYRDRRHDPRSDAEIIPCITNGSSNRPSWPGVEPDSLVGGLADALAALSVRRSGMRYSTLLELFSTTLGLEVRDNPSLFFDLIRGWAEAGTIDIAHAQGRRATYVLARRPGFVAFRLGSRVRASLLGLVPTVLEAQVRRAVEGVRGARSETLLPPCKWLPRVLRVECDDSSLLQAISTDLGLAPPRWLRWPGTSPAEGALDIRPGCQELHEVTAPGSFSTEARWNWFLGKFVPMPSGQGAHHPTKGIHIEKRTHRERSPIYVVLVDGEEWAWTYIRNWALVLAYFLDGNSQPFVIEPHAPIHRAEQDDLYLPLPVGRLCAVLGDGLSGPVLGTDEAMKVEGCLYPLGFGYRKALLDWLSETDCVESDGRGY